MATDEELQQIINSMNDELDLYVPGDVENEFEVYQYENLFFYLRQLHYKYSKLSVVEVQDYFYEFYAAESMERSAMTNRLKNMIEVAKSDQEMDEYIRVQELTSQYEQMIINAAPADRPAVLFQIENGRLPTAADDMTEYNALFAEDIQQSQQQNRAVYPQAVLDESLSPLQNRLGYRALSSNELEKYLRGAGVYDGADRNSGFRVEDL